MPRPHLPTYVRTPKFVWHKSTPRLRNDKERGERWGESRGKFLRPLSIVRQQFFRSLKRQLVPFSLANIWREGEGEKERERKRERKKMEGEGMPFVLRRPTCPCFLFWAITLLDRGREGGGWCYVLPTCVPLWRCCPHAFRGQASSVYSEHTYLPLISFAAPEHGDWGGEEEGPERHGSTDKRSSTRLFFHKRHPSTFSILAEWLKRRKKEKKNKLYSTPRKVNSDGDDVVAEGGGGGGGGRRRGGWECVRERERKIERERGRTYLSTASPPPSPPFLPGQNFPLTLRKAHTTVLEWKMQREMS